MSAYERKRSQMNPTEPSLKNLNNESVSDELTGRRNESDLLLKIVEETDCGNEAENQKAPDQVLALRLSIMPDTRPFTRSSRVERSGTSSLSILRECSSPRAKPLNGRSN
jgi:hypothetical protein